MDFGEPKGCVRRIQLVVVKRVGMMSDCLEASRPFHLTIMGLLSSLPQATRGPLRELTKKGGVVRPVSPTYVSAPKTFWACRRDYHENDQ